MSCVLHMTDTSIDAVARKQDELRNEAQRHANEVKLVATLETHAKRAWYIDGSKGVYERRGYDAAQRLRLDAWRYMKEHGLGAEPVQDSLL